MDGSLSKEKFLFYLRQDAFYLAEYGKILAAIAARLEQKEWREAFLGFSGDTVAVEQALHQFYLKDQLVDAEPTTTKPALHGAYVASTGCSFNRRSFGFGIALLLGV